MQTVCNNTIKKMIPILLLFFYIFKMCIGEIHTRSMQIGGQHLTILEAVFGIATIMLLVLLVQYLVCIFSMYTVNSMHILLMLLVCKVIGNVTMQCLLFHFSNCRQYTVPYSESSKLVAASEIIS